MVGRKPKLDSEAREHVRWAGKVRALVPTRLQLAKLYGVSKGTIERAERSLKRDRAI